MWGRLTMATIESTYSPSRAVGSTALDRNMWVTNGATVAVKVLFSIPWCRQSREGQLRPDLADHIRIFESKERRRGTI
jgi:hypothetical protein